MKKFLKMSKLHCFFAMVLCLVGSNVRADAAPTISEFHPTVVASVGDKKIAVFFLKNSLREMAKGEYVADAEIYYAPIGSNKTFFKYVWKVEGDQIASVFFYDWKSPERAGKSMYVLTKTRLSDAAFDGFTYSVMELPIRLEGESASLLYFTGDPSDPALQNCKDGKDLVSGVDVVCDYKDAASIKKYFNLQDK
ncbi:hypothetical protein [Pseudomonas sp. B26(2017)]|uniref:hypothetical protein n=1 Tax=Pseudomonas sp. B26(2017) TaxID=1981732 RepID=UPI00111C5DA7|nr:hypothetical protein [Pseudomonas sp. B26(2017)]